MLLRSPYVSDVSWGTMTVDGLGTGKDFKLYPGGGRVWDWQETGTSHVPGVQPEDVLELLEHGAEVVVIGCGIQQQLRVQQATLDLLAHQNVTAHIHETTTAVTTYNRIAATEAVGALFHSTC